MIEHDIPPPKTYPEKPLRAGNRRENPLPRAVLGEMQVNDSVKITGEPRVLQNARVAAITYGKATDKRFISRADGTDSIRIWRVA